MHIKLLEIIANLNPFILAIAIIILSRSLNKQHKYIIIIEERLRLIDQKIIDCEQGIMLAHKFLSAVRQRSMDHAIKEATENPEKYMTGEFQSYTVNPESGKDM